MKISESRILSIQFYAGSKFCVINTIAPLKFLSDLLQDLGRRFMPGCVIKVHSDTTILIDSTLECNQKILPAGGESQEDFRHLFSGVLGLVYI